MNVSQPKYVGHHTRVEGPQCRWRGTAVPVNIYDLINSSMDRVAAQYSVLYAKCGLFLGLKRITDMKIN